jgi:SNF2 family DNA or RNA helicase
LRVLVRHGVVQPALVIVPVGLPLQWRQQFRTWAPELSLATVIGTLKECILRWRSPAQIHLVGYEVLRNDRLLPAPLGPGRRLWDVVVTDEAQRIKNDDTELSMVLKSLYRTRSWDLTCDNTCLARDGSIPRGTESLAGGALSASRRSAPVLLMILMSET